MKRLAIALGAVIALAAGGAALLWTRSSGRIRLEGWDSTFQLAPGVSVREGKLAGFPAWRIVDLAVDPARAELHVVRAPHGARLFHLVPPGAVAAVNGGYFDRHFRPTGWLVDRGHPLARREKRAQGGVLALRPGGLYIGPLSGLPFPPQLAVQNSPRLVETGGAVGIRSDTRKRAARTLACDVEGLLHLVVIAAHRGDGPTLLQAARLLAAPVRAGGLGCDAALNLDGGPSSGIWLPRRSGVAGVDSAAPIAYALAVLPH